MKGIRICQSGVSNRTKNGKWDSEDMSLARRGVDTRRFYREVLYLVISFVP